ncbi:PREDICTED: uncharacterized protein LOC104807314 [Tarenaya hassleriana]|uniref:uncharacterized protein LOC104807314 n=1 Tax=Tarenaya hassleriana TaxID=28532 RepID=UPI00053C1D05|nr:PREDICTED: uncharacterized protein LOC104807314 [Tarenaya hassleriana]
MADNTPSLSSATSDIPSSTSSISSPVNPNPDPSSVSLPQLSSVHNLDPYANPLFLHAADSSSFTLVSEKLQGETNYNLWSRSVIKALITKNKLGFIFGTLPKPSESHPDFGAWSRCNALVGTWLANSVSSEIARLITYLDEADVIWQTLETRYKQKNVSKIFNVEQKIESLHQGASDLNTFFTKLNTLWEELKNYEPYPVCSCGGCTCQANAKFIELCERRKVVQFLMKLNESYYPARRQILMLEPLPSISKVYNLISQEEHQRQTRSTSSDSVVFQTSASSFTRGKPSFTAQTKSRPVCAHCGLQGHMVHRCYKLHGYPPSSRFLGSSKPPLLPRPKSGSDSKNHYPVNMIVSETGHVPKTSTMEQAQALFENFQSQLKLLGPSSTSSDLVADPKPSPTPGPYAGLDDWEG